MSEYTLYCFAESGNAYKAALMLNLCSADWTPRFVDFFNGESRSPEFTALNELGEVPILKHKQLTLSQSGVILDYLSQQLNQFGPRNEVDQREILRWLLYDNHKFTSYNATLRFLRTFTQTGENDVTAFFEGRAKTALKTLNTHLKQRQFVIGDYPTIADFSLCGYMFFEDEIGISFQPFSEIKRWLDQIQTLPNWQHPYDLMPKG